MNPFLVFVGLSGLTYLFARDALAGEITFADHVLPMLILVAVVVFRRPIIEKLKTFTEKINAKAEAMEREERHLRKEKPTHDEPPRSQRDHRTQEVSFRQRLDEQESSPVEVVPENRDLNKEAWCWYHRTSKEFFEGAINASQAVVDFFGREAAKRGLADFGRNDQVYNAWYRSVLRLTVGLERTRFGDYQTIYGAAEGIKSDIRGITQWVFMGWLEEAEEEFERLMGIASEYAGRIIETLRPGLEGGSFWLEDVATATPEQRAWSFGPIGERITFFLKDYGEGRTYKDRLPHFNQHPVPEVFPGYEPDMSRPCKAGERVPWTGVWYPEPGIARHSLTFAIEGLPMPPAWKIIKTEEERQAEGDRDPYGFLSPIVEVTDMTWYPLLEVPPVKEKQR